MEKVNEGGRAEISRGGGRGGETDGEAERDSDIESPNDNLKYFLSDLLGHL